MENEAIKFLAYNKKVSVMCIDTTSLVEETTTLVVIWFAKESRNSFSMYVSIQADYITTLITATIILGSSPFLHLSITILASCICYIPYFQTTLLE